ncbi:RecQ-mediated genome instability protein 1 [Tanacetum coccineum]
MYDFAVNGHGDFSLGSLLMLDCILSCQRLLAAYLVDYCFRHILIRLGGVSSLTYQFTGNLTFGGAAGASSHFFVCLLDYAKTRLENGFTAELFAKGTTPASVNERVSSRTEVESSFLTRMENLEPLPSMATTESSIYMETKSASFFFLMMNMSMALAEDNHFASGRSNESPFKIKCFVTGVKRFQYKERSTYKLHVFVNDGILIPEILIDHSFVQKTIGYSPEEVIAAVSSSDPSRGIEMKNIMEEFQDFLATLEGAMVLRIDEASSPPTALDLQQGCPPADAWSLLTRLTPSNADQRPQLDSIDLTP